ncbi:MAG: hypothetical protein ACRBDI_05800 [Alphaproteobacteria bacterium]
MLNLKFSDSGLKDRFLSALKPKNGVLPSLTFVLFLSIGTAWSYDGNYTPYDTQNVSRETLHNQVPSSVMADQCLPLLDTHKTQTSSSIDGNQRAVGQVAALGIILGARFALEPKNNFTDLRRKNAKTLTIKGALEDKNARSAHAIANYRKCLKQMALNRTVNQNEV